MRKIRQCPLCGQEANAYVRIVTGSGNPRIQLAVKCSNYKCSIEKTKELSSGTPMEAFEQLTDDLIREWNIRPEADELEEKYQKAIGVIAASDCSDCAERENCTECEKEDDVHKM